jgi:hypothetical protein
MTIARRSDGKLVVHSPIALSEPMQQQLAACGDVAFIVVPSRFHRLDAHHYRVLYPNARVLCPIDARARVMKKVPVDGTYGDYPQDDFVQLEYLVGLARSEGFMTVKSKDGWTLVFCDLLMNFQHAPGLFWLLYGRVLGASGGLKVPRHCRWLYVADAVHLRRSLEELAALPDLNRIIPGHGDLVTEAAGAALGRAAAGLVGD